MHHRQSCPCGANHANLCEQWRIQHQQQQPPPLPAQSQAQNREKLVMEVILKVDMNCEGCAYDVVKCLRGFDGVEEIETNLDKSEVIVRGENLDARKIWERMRKRYSRDAKLISPKLPPEIEKEEPEKKKIPVKVVVLEILMDSESCAQEVKTSIHKMKGVHTVQMNMEEGTVTVEGAFELPKLVERIKKRLGKHALMVSAFEPAAADKKASKPWEKPPPLLPPMGHHLPHCYMNSSHYMNHVCPWHTFSDENANACSIL